MGGLQAAMDLIRGNLRNHKPTPGNAEPQLGQNICQAGASRFHYQSCNTNTSSNCIDKNETHTLTGWMATNQKHLRSHSGDVEASAGIHDINAST